MRQIVLLTFFVSLTLAAIPWVPTPRGQAWIRLHQGFKNNSLANGKNITVVFVGDSITQGWDDSTYSEHYAPLGSANYGSSGDRTENVVWRIVNDELITLSPRVCVLLIGTNNIGNNNERDIARGISAITDQISRRLPNTKILLVGVLPRQNADTTAITDNINNLISIHDNGNTIRFLNLRDAFYKGNGTFYNELYKEDLIHLSAAGYAKWQQVMDPLFTEMYNSTLTTTRTSRRIKNGKNNTKKYVNQ